jgi:hypothetical protein
MIQQIGPLNEADGFGWISGCAASEFPSQRGVQ